MKKILKYFSISIFILALFSGCDEDDEVNVPKLPSSIAGTWIEDNNDDCKVTLVLKTTSMNWSQSCFGTVQESWESGFLDVESEDMYFRISDSTYYIYYEESSQLYLRHWNFKTEPILVDNWWENQSIGKWVFKKK